ncbi:hypothetical protein OH540_06615 [Streptomyces sp. BPPL-273]|nr:hypothetical protein [Streptomyces sp. BPPL-273]WHM29706.1 hypothetical protein OH540_06615 [Streptomyces sp. BPPL-273]
MTDRGRDHGAASAAGRRHRVAGPNSARTSAPGVQVPAMTGQTAW